MTRPEHTLGERPGQADSQFLHSRRPHLLSGRKGRGRIRVGSPRIRVFGPRSPPSGLVSGKKETQNKPHKTFEPESQFFK